MSKLSDLYGPEPPRLSIDELVEMAALKFNLPPASILREVRKETPVGRMILHFLEEPVSEKRNGRAVDDGRTFMIWFTVRKLAREGYPPPYAAAGELLYREGIQGNGVVPRPMAPKSVERAYRRAERACVARNIDPDEFFNDLVKAVANANF